MLVMFGVGLGEPDGHARARRGRRRSRRTCRGAGGSPDPSVFVLILAAVYSIAAVERGSYPQTRGRPALLPGPVPNDGRGHRRHARLDPRRRPLGLLGDGLGNLSTRNVADNAGVPLSQIHDHFGSKHQLVLAILEAENGRLLERQRAMFGAPGTAVGQVGPACDFLDEDLRPGMSGSSRR